MFLEAWTWNTSAGDTNWACQAFISSLERILWRGWRWSPGAVVGLVADAPVEMGEMEFGEKRLGKSTE